MLVLFSDGEAHDQSKAVRVAREMKAKGVAILSVAIGKGQTVNKLMEQLQQISSKKEYTFKSNFNALATIEGSLVKDMCKAVGKYTEFWPGGQPFPLSIFSPFILSFHFYISR